MKQYIFPAILSTLLTVSTAVTGWTAIGVVDLLSITAVLDERVRNNSIMAMSASELGAAALETVEFHQSEQFHDGVPQLIADALTVQALASQLTTLRSDYVRMGRIIDGYTTNPASPADEIAWVELQQDIETTCDRLVRLGGNHRLCQ